MRIEDYALIGDMQTAALVGRDGSIDWLCLPRFDSAACFAALLDEPRAGRWLLAPADGAARCERRYRPDTLVLESTWQADGGCVRVLDFMPPRGEAPDVVRIVEGVHGRVEMRTELALRFDYGRVVPWTRYDGGELAAVAGPDSAWLDAPVPLDSHAGTATSGFAVAAGDRLPFVLTWQQSWLPRPARVDAFIALDDTESAWTGWLRDCAYRGDRYGEAVRRSLLTLKALTYAPTGGMVAAPTTSLPEQIGGGRNWDYRYSWLRDAAFTLRTLLASGYEDEARAWRDWLLRAVAGDPADLQIMYTLDGSRRIPEWRADWLRGYEGSRPVRIGNAAYAQVQLDVYGEVLDCLYQGRMAGLCHDDDAWELQRNLMDYLEGHWRDPDQSLWEIRGPKRQFTHSKVLAWAAADRMVRTVEAGRHGGPADRWKALREEIHREVCEHGYDADRGTFTQFYGSRGVDAALLLIPRIGFLPPGDERVAGTVEVVRRELSRDGLVLRHRHDLDNLDELTGGEGTFLACSFWLADALAMLGRRDEARELFERLLELRNDVGLLAEEYDTALRRQVGNFPQAYSHLAVINTAAALEMRPMTALETAQANDR